MKRHRNAGLMAPRMFRMMKNRDEKGNKEERERRGKKYYATFCFILSTLNDKRAFALHSQRSMIVSGPAFKSPGKYTQPEWSALSAVNLGGKVSAAFLILKKLWK